MKTAAQMALEMAATQRRIEQRAATDSHKAELRRLQIEKKELALAISGKKQQAKIDINVAKALNTIQLNQLRTESAASRVDAENQALTAPLNTSATIEASDADARSKLVKAVPWVLGGLVVLGGLYMLKRRSSR